MDAALNPADIIAAKRLTRIDIADGAQLRRRGLHSRQQENIGRFSDLTPDLAVNLHTRAISPFSGAVVEPAAHFGIDSDPWMHAIRYQDDARSFIVICRGLTQACVLGAILLPSERLLIEVRDGWYFREVYLGRIGRNRPRIERFFARNPRTPLGDPGKRHVIVATIGNKRVGDYFMQLAWLEDVLARQADSVDVQHVIVNRSSEFLAVPELFPELQNRIERQASASHIEHRARHFAAPVLSDVRPLSDQRLAEGLRRRFRHLIERKAKEPAVQAMLAPFSDCPLTLWISLEFEKRVWAQQVSGLAALLTEVGRSYLHPGEPLGLVLNGMTGVQDGVTSELAPLLAKEAELFSRVLAGIQWPVRVVSAAGRTLCTKAVLADRCNLVLAPVGSATLLPSLILEKPGIVYGTRSESRPAFVGRCTRIVPEAAAEHLPDLKGAIPWFFSGSESYSLDWRCVLQALRSQLAWKRTRDGTFVFEPQT